MSLVDLSVRNFTRELASDSPAPGGGCVAALTGVLAASLVAMVARLTVGNEKYQDSWPEMERVRDEAERIGSELTELVDMDTDAYNQVVLAFRLPKSTDRQKTARKEALQKAMCVAAKVPLQTLREVAGLLPLVLDVLEKGNPNCVTDAGTAAHLLRAAAAGAAYNVRINLGSVADKEFCESMERKTFDLLRRVTETVDRLDSTVTRAILS